METNMSKHAEVAKLIRKHLKDNYISVKSVRSATYSGGTSVNVVLLDAPANIVKEVTKHVGQYEMGTFDPTDDSYHHNNLNDKIPQVRYVFISVEYSKEFRQAVLDILRNKYPDDYINVSKSIDDANLEKTYSGEYVSAEIRNYINSNNINFSELKNENVEKIEPINDATYTVEHELNCIKVELVDTSPNYIQQVKDELMEQYPCAERIIVNSSYSIKAINGAIKFLIDGHYLPEYVSENDLIDHAYLLLRGKHQYKLVWQNINELYVGD